MTIKILMPALSPTMTEGNLAKWHVKEGDEVNPGDVIAEIETDKATMEVESIDEGIVGKILVPEGTEAVQVNSTIGVLLEDGEDASAIGEGRASAGAAPAVSSPPGNADAKASPLAKRIAEQTGVDLGSVAGSGAHGKVVKADVESAMSVGAVRSGGQVDVVTDGLAGSLDADGNRIFASPLARGLLLRWGSRLPASREEVQMGGS